MFKKFTDSVRTRWQKLRWALTPPRVKQARLDAMYARVREEPEAAALLDLALSRGVKISFSAKLIGTDTIANHSAYYKRIRVNPITGNGRDDALAHELFHALQDATVGLSGAWRYKLSPLDHLIFDRMVEATAFAFQSIYASKRFTATCLREQFAQAASPQEKQNVQDSMERFRGFVLPADMCLDFFSHALLALPSSYDEGSLKTVHRIHVKKLFGKNPSRNPVQTQDLRNMGVVGEVRYLDHLSDRALRVTALRYVDPRLRKTVRLIDAFSAASAAGDTQRVKALKHEIDARMKQPTLKKTTL